MEHVCLDKGQHQDELTTRQGDSEKKGRSSRKPGGNMCCSYKRKWLSGGMSMREFQGKRPSKVISSSILNSSGE